MTDYYAPENRAERMAEYQRRGIGLVLGFDGNWHADHLTGLEREQVELLVNAEMALTHDVCAAGGAQIAPAGTFRAPCPTCGQDVGTNVHGVAMPHTTVKELKP